MINKKIKVCSSQYNFRYSTQIHCPYTIGMLVAYVKTFPEINDNFEFQKTFVIRDNFEKHVKQAKDADILMCSIYVWNEQITFELIKKTKEINPNCFIIVGGPQVPENRIKQYVIENNIDVAVQDEGEFVLSNVLKEYLTNKDFSNIKGITTKDFINPKQERIRELDKIPSPYLTGLIYDLVEVPFNNDKNITWICCMETVRGCGFSCTFCNWGSATFQKMFKFNEERAFAELQWFVKNKIPYIDLCDSNFGAFIERDLRIAKYAKELNLSHGKPIDRIRPSWAKNSSNKIMPIAREFRDGGFLGGITLAMQSFDETTLNIIKRANIKYEKFDELIKEFNDENISQYSELIFPLPGETLETFKNGLDLLSNTKVSCVYIYNCGILANSPMDEYSYRKKYKIEGIHSPIYLAHSHKDSRDIPEYEEIAISTFSASTEMVKDMYDYAWMFLTFQNLGHMEYIGDYFKYSFDIKYMEFYETLLKYIKENKEENIFSNEYKHVVALKESGYSGNGWNHVDENLGDIVWNLEEASWLRFNNHGRSKLKEEYIKFINYFAQQKSLTLDENIINNLIDFQLFCLTFKEDKDNTKTQSFEYDWKSYFTNKEKEPQIGLKTYKREILIHSDNEFEWNHFAIWYGRKNRKFMSEAFQLETIITIESN